MQTPLRPACPPERVDAPQPMAFAELCITSNFTFLTGGSHPQEYALRAIELGLPAFAIADRNSVAGLVRAHQELQEAARGGGAVPRLLPAARLCLAEGPELTALPATAPAGAALPGADRRRAPAPRRATACSGDDLGDLGDVHLLLHPPAGPAPARLAAAGARLRRGGTRTRIWSPARATTARTGRASPGARLAGELGLPLVASAEPIMHHGAAGGWWTC